MFKIALIAVTLMTAVSAQANEFNLPEGVTCNEVFWNADPKNSETLTIKEKCWLDEHRSEDQSGSIGDKLWIKIENEYFSVSKSKLRASFSNEEKAQQALQIEFQRQYRNWKRNN